MIDQNILEEKHNILDLAHRGYPFFHQDSRFIPDTGYALNIDSDVDVNNPMFLFSIKVGKHILIVYGKHVSLRVALEKVNGRVYFKLK